MRQPGDPQEAHEQAANHCSKPTAQQLGQQTDSNRLQDVCLFGACAAVASGIFMCFLQLTGLQPAPYIDLLFVVP